jgi:hypothetical protein
LSEPQWWRSLRGDPAAFLLDESEPGVIWRTLIELLGRPPDSPAAVRARVASRERGTAAALLAGQDPLGYWGSPATYGARWGGTAWHVLALAQLGADPEDPRAALGAETLIEALQPRSAGFAAARNKQPSTCFTAEVCAALTRFGFGHHPRVREAVAWLSSRQAERGGWACPDLRHLVSGGCPVTAVAVLRLVGDTPVVERRPLEVLRQHAATWLVGLGLFLSGTAPAGWWSCAHPCLGRTDFLDAMAALARSGWPAGPALHAAMRRGLERQTGDGRWLQRGSVPFGERSGEPSRWLTLKALVALAAYHGEAAADSGGAA